MTIRILLVATLFAAVSGCGGGGSSSSSAPAEAAAPPSPPVQTGELAVVVTDAEGDFVVYEVNVERIDLTTAAGAQVQTIPAQTRIDFAQLTELSELLTVASIPAGVYTSVVLQLDFSDAVVMVQDAGGEIRTATLEDAEGAPLSRAAIGVELAEKAPIRIGAAALARVSLDFDLDASNEVVSFDPAVVRVQPFVLATAELDESRDLRIHGVLEAVSEAGGITVDLQPLRQRPATPGSFEFATDADTIWEIDDADLVGDAGLDALADVALGARLLAAGPVTDGALVADLVLVGTAVPGVGGDVVAGAVLARSDNLLTLGGVRVHRAGGPDAFFRRVQLAVDDTTSVTLRAAGARSGEEVGIAALSVGARVLAGAEETQGGEIGAVPVFDASGARVRLRRSSLTAEVVTADPLVVDLVRLDGRRAGVFDFAGTGADATLDADPERYEIDPGVLAVTGLELDDIIRVRGLVSDFGAAPPDFAAESLVDVAVDDRGARLRASWEASGGSADALVELAPDRLSVDLADARASLRVRGILRDLLPASEALTLIPAAGGPLLLSLRAGPDEDIRVFDAFADFVDALLEGLQAGERVGSLVAEGRYDRGISELSVRRVRVQWVP